MGNEINKDTKINIGLAVGICIFVLGSYRLLEAEIDTKIKTRVDTKIYEAEKKMTNDRLSFIEEKFMLRFNMVTNDVSEIKELMLEERRKGG